MCRPACCCVACDPHAERRLKKLTIPEIDSLLDREYSKQRSYRERARANDRKFYRVMNYHDRRACMARRADIASVLRITGVNIARARAARTRAVNAAAAL